MKLKRSSNAEETAVWERGKLPVDSHVGSTTRLARARTIPSFLFIYQILEFICLKVQTSILETIGPHFYPKVPHVPLVWDQPHIRPQKAPTSYSINKKQHKTGSAVGNKKNPHRISSKRRYPTPAKTHALPEHNQKQNK